MRTLIITILLTGFASIISSQDFVYNSSQDLNSDGKLDSIKVENTNNFSEFRLTINDQEILGKFDDGGSDGFKIVDINKWDKYKEIAVHTPGPSNDDEYMIYWYDGKNILFISHLTRWPEFRGNGIVYLNNWEGFWSSRDKYVFDNSTKRLNHVEQYAYYVGRKIKITKGFEIYKEKELINKVALLANNSEMEIILCDKKDRGYYEYRYLIKSESNLLGWAKFRTIWDNAEIPMAD